MRCPAISAEQIFNFYYGAADTLEIYIIINFGNLLSHLLYTLRVRRFGTVDCEAGCCERTRY